MLIICPDQASYETMLEQVLQYSEQRSIEGMTRNLRRRVERVFTRNNVDKKAAVTHRTITLSSIQRLYSYVYKMKISSWTSDRRVT